MTDRDFMASTRRAKLSRKKNPRAVVGRGKKVRAPIRPPEQKVLYQAMLTKKDRILRNLIANERRAEEHFKRRMQELKEAPNE